MNRLVRKIIAGIKNYWRWRKVIWHDADWDHTYILKIFITKLRFQAKSIREQGIHQNANLDASRMELCANLLEKVQTEYYIDEVLADDNFLDANWDKAIAKHEKAKKLAFALLERHIEQWWD